jgi:hypothetical protein
MNNTQTPQSTTPAAMLDPTWTPAAGYSHAHDLLAIATKAEQDRDQLADLPTCECGGPLDSFGNCEYAAGALARLVAAPSRRQQAASYRVHGTLSRAVAS